MLVGMKSSWLGIAVWLLAMTAPLFGQLPDADARTQAECKKYLATPLPAEASQVTAPKSWPDCYSYKSYSGIGTKVDYAAARRCAWSERLAIQDGQEPTDGAASVFGGSAMLSVLFANGQGVSRNYPLAIRFACEAGGAPAEIGMRVRHLESLQANLSSNTPDFDFCDDITSGYMEGFCAAYQSEIAEEQRDGQLEALSARFTSAQRSAFDRLRRLQQRYARAHARGEIDLSGTARAMYQIDAEDTLRDDFLAALRSYEAGKYPTGSAEAYRGADARLNSEYRKAMSDAEAHKSEYGAVQPEGIRDAERAWIKYRDAWVTFAKLRYPTVPADAWLVLLTNDRTSILDGSFCDMDAEDGACARGGAAWKPGALP